MCRRSANTTASLVSHLWKCCLSSQTSRWVLLPVDSFSLQHFLDLILSLSGFVSDLTCVVPTKLWLGMMRGEGGCFYFCMVSSETLSLWILLQDTSLMSLTFGKKLILWETKDFGSFLVLLVFCPLFKSI